MVADDYASRLSQAMGAGGERPDSGAMHELAGALGITYQAVAKLWSDSSKAFTAFNNSRAARKLKVSSDWLATGEGAMQPEVQQEWPFDRVDRARWDECNDVDRGYIQSAINRALDDCEANRQRITAPALAAAIHHQGDRTPESGATDPAAPAETPASTPPAPRRRQRPAIPDRFWGGKPAPASGVPAPVIPLGSTKRNPSK